MAQINRISSFKTFSEIKASQAATQLAEENAAKRSEITAKIASLLDEMEINSFEELEEDTKREFITKAFGNVSEEEVEVEVTDEVAEEEVEDEVAEEEAEEEVEVEESVVNEAVIVTGKRDAKKVFNAYNKFFEAYPALGRNAMGVPKVHHIGAVKGLYAGAMQDANFSREVPGTVNQMKGRLFPVELKVADLNNTIIKVSTAKLNSIIDDNYSAISGAAKWSGIGIVEGTALYLDSIGETKQAENLIAAFNKTFESVEIMEAKVQEGRAFVAAARKAKDEGKEEFEYEGKTYPVLLKEDIIALIAEGTRGQFGKIDKAGNITSVYTHYDSYPENVLPIIKKSFKGGKNVDTVIDKGANSGLDANISKINFYGDGTEATKGSVKKIDQYLKNAADDGGAEYVYLWDEGSKTWMMADIYGDMKLVPAFESVQVEEGNAFGDAVRKAKEAGETEFEFEGETFKVEESEVTEAKFVKDFNRDVLKAKTREEVLELYPNAEFFIGKSDHFFGELDGNLFFKAYYTKAQKEFEIKSVYSEKGSNYVHLYNESVVTEAKAWDKLNKIADEIHGEFGFASLGEDDMAKHIDLKKADKLADKMFGEFGFASLSEDEMQELINRNPKIVNESVVNEAEIKSDEEFKEYATTVLQKAFGEEYDEAKAGEVIDGILSKSDGDYGAAVGMLTSSLG